MMKPFGETGPYKRVLNKLGKMVDWTFPFIFVHSPDTTKTKQFKPTQRGEGPARQLWKLERDLELLRTDSTD